MAEPLKVQEDEFKPVIRALLNTKPTPASDITRNWEVKAKKPGTKKRP